MNDTPNTLSTRPYLIRALYEWCTANRFTPYLAVSVDAGVQVPMEFVQNGEIVLNIGLDATTALKLGNDYIEFKARFSGAAREIMVPVSQVLAIYARENGQGMSFPLLPSDSSSSSGPAGLYMNSGAESPLEIETETETGSKPVHLSRVETKKKDAVLGDHREPPRTPPGGGRPTLKRVK